MNNPKIGDTLKQVNSPLIRKEVLLYWCAVGCIFGYLCLRAHSVPLVHDEAGTFYHYVQQGKFLPFDSHWDAGNHYLNTGLTTFFSSLFGESDFVLRLANLLGFLFYAYYILQFARRFLPSFFSRIVLYSSLLLLHGVIEYFGYFRGYGLSFAFFMASYYWLLKYLSEADFKSFLWHVLFSIGVIWSNLNFIPLLGLLWFWSFFKTRNKTHFLLLVIHLPVVWVAFELKRRDLLYYGMDSFSESVVSINQLILEDSLLLRILELLILTGFIWFGIVDVLLHKDKRTAQKAFHWQVGLFMLMSLFGMHFFLKVNYPQDRTGLHIVLFFLIGLAFLVEELKVFKITKVLSIVWVVVLLGFFLNRVNLSHSKFWKGEHLGSGIMKTLSEQKIESISAHFLHQLTWARNVYCKGYSLPQVQYNSFPDTLADVIIINTHKDSFALKNYHKVFTQKNSPIAVYARNEPFLFKEFYSEEYSQSTSDNEYLKLGEITCDSGAIYAIDAIIEFEAIDLDQIFTGRLVLEVSGSTKEYIAYPFHWTMNPISENTFKQRIIVGPLELGDRIKVYIWNPQKDSIPISKKIVRYGYLTN